MVSEVIFFYFFKKLSNALSTGIFSNDCPFIFPFGPEAICRGQRSSWGMQLSDREDKVEGEGYRVGVNARGS